MPELSRFGGMVIYMLFYDRTLGESQESLDQL